jgi:hypothetical protein
MSLSEKTRNLEEIGRLGTDLIERCILSYPPRGSADKFIAVDVESGEYEVDENEIAAICRLRARIPGAEVYLGGTGDLAMDRLGFR